MPQPKPPGGSTSVNIRIDGVKLQIDNGGSTLTGTGVNRSS